MLGEGIHTVGYGENTQSGAMGRIHTVGLWGEYTEWSYGENTHSGAIRGNTHSGAIRGRGYWKSSYRPLP